HTNGQSVKYVNLGTGFDLVQRQACIAHTYTQRQIFSVLLQSRHSVSRAVARCWRAENFHGGNAVVTHQLGRTKAPLAVTECAKGHHVAIAVAHIPFRVVFRRHSGAYISLYIDTLDSTTVDKVVHVHGTPGRLNGFIDLI